MRTLGFLFVILLILCVVGYSRGWLSFGTTHAADKNEVRVEFDKDKLDRDTAKAADKIGELSAKTVEQIEKLVKKVSPERSSLEGEAASIDTASRTLVLTTGTERVVLVVPTTATITSGGQTVALERVPTGRHVRVDLEKRDERWRVTKVEVLS
jgi:hypothetical protein